MSEIFDKQDRTIEAILIHLRKHIHDEGYTFPSSSRIEYAIGLAVHKICGTQFGKKGPIDYPNNRLEIYSLDDKSKISKNVLSAICNIFHSGSDAWGDQLNNPMDDYLMHNNRRVDWRWFYGYGDMFKFKTGWRKVAEESVKKYWTEKELEDFRIIGKLVSKTIIDMYKK